MITIHHPRPLIGFLVGYFLLALAPAWAQTIGPPAPQVAPSTYPATPPLVDPAVPFGPPSPYAQPQPFVPGPPYADCPVPCEPVYCEPCVCCPPFWQHRDRIFAEYLFLSATNVDLNYATPVNALGALGTPTGPASFVDPGYESGFRVGGGWAIDEENSLTAAYWFYQSDAEDQAAIDPAGMGPTLFLNPVLLDPATISVVSESSRADASYDIDFQMVDLAHEQLISHGCKHAVNLILGARFGRLEQDLRANYSILGGTSLDTNIDFAGVGPRVGLSGERHFRNGFFGYGQGTGNFLIGTFEADYLQRNTFAGVQSNVSFEDDRIVSLLDLELGIGWQSPCGRVRLKAGYYLASWFNAMTTPAVIDAVQTRHLQDVSDTLTFSGLATRLELQF